MSAMVGEGLREAMQDFVSPAQMLKVKLHHLAPAILNQIYILQPIIQSLKSSLPLDAMCRITSSCSRACRSPTQGLGRS